MPVKAMKTFRVVWEIDIDAETPEDAAHQALEIQRDEENTAVVFDVIDGENKQRVRIDLLTGVATGGTA